MKSKCESLLKEEGWIYNLGRKDIKKQYKKTSFKKKKKDMILYLCNSVVFRSEVITNNQRVSSLRYRSSNRVNDRCCAIC
jgi:hypothetical protein